MSRSQRRSSPIAPSLPTLVPKAPDGGRWLHEIKHDGYRLMVSLDREGVQLFTRNGLDWTRRFPRVAEAARRLPVESAYIDGEVVVEDEDGLSDWPALHVCAARGNCPSALLWAFDLPFLNGRDLRALPLIERKEMLASIIPPDEPWLHYVDHVEGSGPVVFEHACRLGVEGIVSKLRDSRYQSGRTSSWLKTKCMLRGEFIVAGYLPMEGSSKSVGALILGKEEDGRIIRAGKVGTGFTARSSSEIAQVLDLISRPTPPFAEPLPRRKYPKARWAEPLYAALVEYRGWTGDGLLRHPSFKGLKER